LGADERSGTLVIMESVARHVFVTGRVQGVAFRWHARDRARSLGLRGWVRNLDDGRVEAWIEGAEAQVERMLAWLRQGPPASRVQDLRVSAVSPAGHAGFEIARSGFDQR
jgi:acylphosphatase